MTSKEKNIEKDINEIMDYIKDLKEENKKQKEILEILKRTKLDLWDFKYDIENFKECVSERTPYEWYSMHYREFSREVLSEKEFDLVWEWLEDEK